MPSCHIDGFPCLLAHKGSAVTDGQTDIMSDALEPLLVSLYVCTVCCVLEDCTHGILDVTHWMKSQCTSLGDYVKSVGVLLRVNRMYVCVCAYC